MNAILASRDFARAMQIQDTIFMIVTGRKPRPSSFVRLQRLPGKLIHLRITFSPEARPLASSSEEFFLLQPVKAGAARGYILLEHAGGCDAIRIEAAEAVVADLRVRLAAQQVNSSGSPSSVGFSQNFSIDEALREAVSRLPANAASCDQESVVDVIGLGVLCGGFQVVSRLFVKVERSCLASESGFAIARNTLRANRPAHEQS